MSIKKIILNKFLLAIAVLFLLSEFVYLILPFCVNADFLAKVISNNLQKHAETFFVVENPKLHTYPDFTFKIDANKVYVYDKSETILDIEKLGFKSALFPLFLKHVDILKLDIKKLSTNVVWEKDKRLGLKNKKLENYLYSFNFKVDADKAEINLGTHDINVFDEITRQRLKYSSDNLLYFFENKTLRLKTNSKLIAGHKTTYIKIDTEFVYPIKNFFENQINVGTILINNLDMQSLQSFVPQKYLTDIKKMSGTIDFTLQKDNFDTAQSNIFVNANNLKIIYDKPEKSMITNGRTILMLPFEKQKNSIIIKKANLSGDGYTVGFSGKVNDLKKSDIDFDLNISPSKLKSLIWLLPDFLKPKTHPQLLSEAKHYGLTGDIRGNLKISGNKDTPDIDGNIAINNAYFEKGKINDASVKVNLKFTNKKVYVDAKADIAPKQFFAVTGFSDLYQKEYGEYSIKTSQKTDLLSSFNILKPLSKMFGFQIGMLHLMDMKGYGNLELQTKGDLTDYRTDGIFNFYNSDFSVDGIAEKVQNSFGSLVFAGKKVTFNTKSAHIGKSSITIDGVSSFDGDFDYSLKLNDLPIERIITVLKNSEWTKKQSKMLDDIDCIAGLASIDLGIKGKMKEITPENIAKNVHYKGILRLKDCSLKTIYSPVITDSITGKIDFQDTNYKLDLQSKIEKSPVKILGLLSEKKANIKITSKDFRLESAVKLFINQFKLKNINIKTNSKLDWMITYKSDIDKRLINPDAIKMTGKVVPSTKKSNEFLSLASGNFEIKNGQLNFADVIVNLGTGIMRGSGRIDKIFGTKPIPDFKCTLSNLDISFLNKLKESKLLSNRLNSLLNLYTGYRGKINSSFVVRSQGPIGRFTFSDIQFIQKKNNVPVKLNKGVVNFKNNRIDVDSVNGFVADTPFLFDFSVKDIFSQPYFKGNFSAKIDNDFVNNTVNPYLEYPIKIQGDIQSFTELSGNDEKIYVKQKFKIPENADVTYIGANLGDIDTVREILSEIVVENDLYDIKKVLFLKNSHDNTVLPLPKVVFDASAKIRKTGNNFQLKSFSAKTATPINAQLFNPLFKKSTIKQGSFMCSLYYELVNQAPKLDGYIKFKNLDMPIYNTKIEKLNLKIHKNMFSMATNGTFFDSVLSATLKGENIFRYPIVIKNLDIKADNFNTNKILDAISSVTFSNAPNLLKINEKHPFDTIAVIVKRGTLKADKLQFNELIAKNLTSQFVLVKDKLLLIKDVNFDVADGTVNSNGYYNFENGEMNITGDATNVDANAIAGSLFEMKNQIFGALSGKMEFTTHGKTDSERLQNTMGDFTFQINDGKMPKLGSLEYLLKAGNLIKGGFLGLSINHVANLFAPFHTGEFEKIHGSMKLERGIVKDIQVFSKGNNLSMYLTGSYDIVGENAKMQTWGRLTNDRNNLLGPIGNLSINTVFRMIPGYKTDDVENMTDDINKIPPINTKTNDVRIFNAKINGNINGENFVTSFNWVN